MRERNATQEKFRSCRFVLAGQANIDVITLLKLNLKKHIERGCN